MKYIKVTHIESGNEEFYPIINLVLVQKFEHKVILHSVNSNYIEHFNTEKYDIQEVNTLF